MVRDYGCLLSIAFQETVPEGGFGSRTILL